MYEWYERFFTDIEVFAMTLAFGTFALAFLLIPVVVAFLPMPSMLRYQCPPPPWTYETTTEEKKP